MSDETSSTQADAEKWDRELLYQGGHFLQSWRWGEFKSEFGWTVRRASTVGNGRSALVQILFRHRWPIAVGYVPRGPAIPEGDAHLGRSLMAKIDNVSRRERAIYTLLEANRPLPFSGRFKENGFVQGAEHIQPARTVKVSLLEDEALLAQMRQNTRYSVRLATRRGVRLVGPGNEYSVFDFYQLLLETADRNKFGVHSERYYRRFLEIFGDDALCILAESEGNLAAGLIAVRFGKEAIYMYGASSAQYRTHGAAFLLQFEAMKWARDAGCERYDLWGIPVLEPGNGGDEDQTVIGSSGSDLRGLHRFKTGFGGDIVSYPPVLERRYSVIGSFMARRLTSRARGDT